VRLLGGYHDGGSHRRTKVKGRDRDLAYRDEKGGIQYRMNLLEERLQPYKENGYTELTLVMDNIPYCFTRQPTFGDYGQTAPPVDFTEWGNFIKVLCQKLIEIFGRDTANKLRFRMGTENNGKERFNARSLSILNITIMRRQP